MPRSEVGRPDAVRVSIATAALTARIRWPVMRSWTHTATVTPSTTFDDPEGPDRERIIDSEIGRLGRD